MQAARLLVREFGGSYCVTDTYLHPFEADGTPDDRIVWRQGEPRPEARAWIVEQNRKAMIEARTVRP